MNKPKTTENHDFIRQIDAFFQKKRQFVVTMPKQHDAVVLMVSGGIDSIVAWKKLLSEYKLHVFPVHILTGQPRNKYEKKAIEYYGQIFKKLYPDCYHEPFMISQHTTPPEIRRFFRGNPAQWVKPSVLRRHKKTGSNTIWLKREFTFPAFLPYQAVTVAQLLSFKEDVQIRTIILSTLPTDAEYNSSQSLTAIRATMQAICAYTNDYSWQIFSLANEPKLKLNLQKKDLISWADKNDLDLTQTYTCFRGTSLHCGTCLACKVRRQHFQKAKVADKTLYLSDVKNWRTLAFYLSSLVNKLLRRLENRLFENKQVKFHDYF